MHIVSTRDCAWAFFCIKLSRLNYQVHHRLLLLKNLLLKEKVKYSRSLPYRAQETLGKMILSTLISVFLCKYFESETCMNNDIRA